MPSFCVLNAQALDIHFKYTYFLYFNMVQIPALFINNQRNTLHVPAFRVLNAKLKSIKIVNCFLWVWGTNKLSRVLPKGKYSLTGF